MNSSDASDLSGLLRLPSLKVTGSYHDADKHDALIVQVESVSPAPKYQCCLIPIIVKNGRKTIRYRDFPIQDQRVWLELKRQRFDCQFCHTTLYEPLPDLDSEFRMTTRFRVFVEKKSVDLTFVDAARTCGVDDRLVGRVFDAYAKETIGHYIPRLPRVVGMDEKFIQGKPRFVIGDVEKKRLLDIRETRTLDTLKVYIDTLEGRSRVEVVCQDMWDPYRILTKTLLPNAVTVIDKWHVQRNGNYGVENVRKALGRNIEDDKDRRYIRRLAKPLLIRWPTANEERRSWLTKVFTRFPALGEAYFVKERFYDIYLAETRSEAEALLTKWMNSVPADMAVAFKPATSAIKGWRPHILRYFEHRYTSGYVEGTNGLVDKLNHAAAGMDFDRLRQKALLKFGHFRDERKPPSYVSQFEQLYAEKDGHRNWVQDGPLYGEGIDLSTFTDAFDHDWF